MQQDGLLALGGLQSELVKSNDTTASLDDASTGRLGYLQSANVQLWDTQQANIISDSTDDDGNLVTTLVMGLDLSSEIGCINVSKVLVVSEWQGVWDVST